MTTRKQIDAPRWQIYLKGKPVAVEPSTYYPTYEMAVFRRGQLELEQPKLGSLEVREVCGEGKPMSEREQQGIIPGSYAEAYQRGFDKAKAMALPALQAARRFIRGRHSTIPFGPSSLVEQLDVAIRALQPAEQKGKELRDGAKNS